MAYTPEVQDKIAAKVEKFGGLRRDYELVINHKMLDKDGVPSIIDIFTGDYPDRKSQWPQFKSEGYEKYNAEDFKPAGEPVGVKPAKPAGK